MRRRGVDAVLEPAAAEDATDGVRLATAGARGAATEQRGPSLAALPVRVALLGPHATSVRRWVEGVLGWQAVDAATAAFVPPALVLLDTAPGRDADEVEAAGVARVPRVLVVDDGGAATGVADLTLAVRPDAVVSWPSGRERLAALVADLLARAVVSHSPATIVRVGGVSGGVGTTTIALALGGLCAWQGTITLVGVRGASPDLRPVTVESLSSSDIWSRAEPLPGLARLRGVRLVGAGAPPAITDARLARVVLDVGVDPACDVVVCRPDAAALAMASSLLASLVVVVGDGPVPLRRLRRALEGRRIVTVPYSARVARAAVQGRTPAGLPGAWLRRLVPLQRAVHP
jgi:hypothetical protein